MNKPGLKTGKPYFDYDEVINYIEKKYNISVRDYHNTYTGVLPIKTTINISTPNVFKQRYLIEPCTIAELGEYESAKLDFWHWLTDYNTDIRNDSFFWLYPIDCIENEDTPEWVKEILVMIRDEFVGKDDGTYDENLEEMKMWVSW